MSKSSIKNLILKQIETNGETKTMDLVKSVGLSRGYISHLLKEMVEDGSIVMIGKTNKAKYIKADKQSLLTAKKEILSVNLNLVNKNLSEDLVLDQIKRDSGIFVDLSSNVTHVLNYAFTEMMNNAIEHSQSKKIKINFAKQDGLIKFIITDAGIGIFNNIMSKKGLKSELEAIQDLLKGKQTTAPQAHSGEGIFFTSKAGDSLIIESSNKKLIFNNLVEDIFIDDIKNRQGTKIIFAIQTKSKRELEKIFNEYAGDNYEFTKTKVAVRLYKMGDIYISRSQGRRIMVGLDKFKIVELDFKHIKTVGQAFADEIFRIWQIHNPGIKIEVVNSNENIDLMITRSKGEQKKQKYEYI